MNRPAVSGGACRPWVPDDDSHPGLLGAIVLGSLGLFGAASLHGRAAPVATRTLAGLLVILVSLPVAAAGADTDCSRWREAFQGMPRRTAQIASGDRSLSVAAKLADTDERRVAGFQCATAGEIRTTVIVFDFGQELLTQFHMRNVPAPLDIAFAKADGRIFAILRMAPSPTGLYGPLGPFRFAIEARTGFFESRGIQAGAARLIALEKR